MGDKQSFHIVARYLNYPHFRVKEEAIDYLLQANEKVLLDEAESLMDDKDERIRRKIIQALTTLKTKRKEIVLKAVSMLMDENESEEVKKAILSFFSSIRNLKLPDGKTIEGVLIDFIERKKKVFIFKKEESPELKKHAIKILGEIGSTKAIPFLRTLEGKKEYAEEAKMAIKRIAERISSVRK
jgi:HEAT repeat protein